MLGCFVVFDGVYRAGKSCIYVVIVLFLYCWCYLEFGGSKDYRGDAARFNTK